MRAAQESIVGGKDDHRLIMDARVFERLSNAAHSNVDAIDLLIILGHHALVVVAVIPTMKAFELTTLPALLGEMSSILASKIRRLDKECVGINLIELGIRASCHVFRKCE